MNNNEFLYGKFPPGFIWGVATASYQIEGAWDKDGKGESIWDRFVHTPGKVYNGDTGDIACASYDNYLEDVKLMKELNVSHYRFSISWPRILPDGTLRIINQKGIDYYNRLINALLEANIQPMVTLYHWDLPQALEDRGGWLAEGIAQIFQDYASLCFKSFGDRVKLWVTFNEPWVVAAFGYGNGQFAPGHADAPGIKPYIAAHNIIRAHAAAYRIYDQEFRKEQKGLVSIGLQSFWYEPKDSTNIQHLEAAKTRLEFELGWFANPIFKNGDYPEIMKKKIAEKSLEQGFQCSRLPEFTEDEKEFIAGTYDFFGLNHYTTRYIEPQFQPLDPPSIFLDFDSETSTDPAWKKGEVVWLYQVPWGLSKLLQYVSENYGRPPIYILENGYGNLKNTTEDYDRIEYYKLYINEVLRATKLGCNIRGYFAWSLIDNFEWEDGYRYRFGLCLVDYNDPKRKRVIKQSGKYYSQIIKDHGFIKNK